MYLIKNLYQKYTQNSYNWTIRKKHIPIKKWVTCLNILVHYTKEDMHEANKDMKYSQNNLLLGNWHLKQQWDTATDPLEW